jgi:uncharacterized membrane protein YfcA
MPGRSTAVRLSRLPKAAALAALLVPVLCAAAFAADGGGEVAAGGHAWWFWPVVLLALTFVMGVLGVMAGVGGGVLFVPIVSGFLPFHLDFVRGAGLIVALAGALAAGPGLLRKGIADLRLAIPVALVASLCAVAGAMVGLALPTRVVQVLLGDTILAIVFIMVKAWKSEFPDVVGPDRLAQAMHIMGIYHETSLKRDVAWTVHRTPAGLALFGLVGALGGMLGLGTGWASVPVLNLVMGAPIKISVATSKFLLSLTDTSAAWIYMNSGAVLPLIVVPSVVGIMMGSFVGVRLLAVSKPAAVRAVVIIVLGIAAAKSLLMGLGVF